MRLSIRFCRYCCLDSGKCEYRKKIKSAVNNIPFKGTLVHRCPEYWNTIPMYARVKIELFEMKYEEMYMGDGEPTGGGGEWISKGHVEGEVINHSKSGGYFVVKLDKPIKLFLPEQDKGWNTTEEREVDIRLKHSKNIEVLSVPTPEKIKEKIDDLW